MSALAVLFLMFGSPETGAMATPRAVTPEADAVAIVPGGDRRTTALAYVDSVAAKPASECPNARAQMVAEKRSVYGDLLLRDTDEVRVYRPLERHIDGCSTPISWPHAGPFASPQPQPRPQRTPGD